MRFGAFVYLITPTYATAKSRGGHFMRESTDPSNLMDEILPLDWRAKLNAFLW